MTVTRNTLVRELLEHDPAIAAILREYGVDPDRHDTDVSIGELCRLHEIDVADLLADLVDDVDDDDAVEWYPEETEEELVLRRR